MDRSGCKSNLGVLRRHCVWFQCHQSGVVSCICPASSSAVRFKYVIENLYMRQRVVKFIRVGSFQAYNILRKLFKLPCFFRCLLMWLLLFVAYVRHVATRTTIIWGRNGLAEAHLFKNQLCIHRSWSNDWQWAWGFPAISSHKFRQRCWW